MVETVAAGTVEVKTTAMLVVVAGSVVVVVEVVG